MVIRRHTPDAYKAALAAEDYAFQVAREVSPTLAGRPQVTFAATAPRFGKRA